MYLLPICVFSPINYTYRSFLPLPGNHQSLIYKNQIFHILLHGRVDAINESHCSIFLSTRKIEKFYGIQSRLIEKTVIHSKLIYTVG